MNDNNTMRLSPDVQAFIAQTQAAYPPDAAQHSLTQQRGFYDALCARFDRPRPGGLCSHDIDVQGLKLRRYIPAGATNGTILFIHGGGHILGGLDSHDAICAEIADQTGAIVIALAYRLAPEHKHPAGLDDCLTAFAWVMAHETGPVVVAGDSAGGTYAAALCHRHRNTARVAGQVLIYPWLRRTGHIKHLNAPMLTRDDLNFYASQLANGPVETLDGDLFVLGDFVLGHTDFADLPPTTIIWAEFDPLCTDGPDYAAAIIAAGGTANSICAIGQVHGFLRARHSVENAKAAFSASIQALRTMLA